VKKSLKDLKIMNRKELIEALSSGNLKKIIDIKQADEEGKQGKFIGFADLNYLDAEEKVCANTWSIPILGLHEVNKQWVQSCKYSNLSHEELADLIVKHDYQVIAMGYYVNFKFPEHSWAYEPPDPTITPERKYLEILKNLKEIAYLHQKIKGVTFRSGAEMTEWLKAEEKLMPENL
jgi:hypothetical protein